MCVCVAELKEARSGWFGPVGAPASAGVGPLPKAGPHLTPAYWSHLRTSRPDLSIVSTKDSITAIPSETYRDA